MPRSNPPTSCLKRLGESHQKDHCKICRGFRSRTQKERAQRLKILLMEAALCPHSELSSAKIIPSMSASVQSMLASTREASELRKDSDRDSQPQEGCLQRGSAPTSVCSTAPNLQCPMRRKRSRTGGAHPLRNQSKRT